jgi:hypothetical protein
MFQTQNNMVLFTLLHEILGTVCIVTAGSDETWENTSAKTLIVCGPTFPFIDYFSTWLSLPILAHFHDDSILDHLI